MNEKLWFRCLKCFLAFSSKGEYEKHYEVDHLERGIAGADLLERRG